MTERNEYLRRLGELELERSAVSEQIEILKEELTKLDKEYIAIRSILSSSVSDGRWASQNTSLPEMIYSTLKQVGRPLHYKEIYERLQSENFHIVGTASIQNLVVRLNRDSRFEKLDRGIYGLSEWNNRKTKDNLDVPRKLHIDSVKPRGNSEMTIREKRELEKVKFLIESNDIDIQITKNNITALRDKLLGRISDYQLPDNIDPQTASISFEKKLIKLLEQQEQLNSRRAQLEHKSV